MSHNISPHEWLIKQPPDLSYLHIFGCLTYAHTMTQQSKFNPTSQKLVFIGYDNSTKGYKLWNPSSHKIVISTDVMFEESIFPLCTPKPPNTQLSSVPEHLPLLPPKLDDLALPESNNKDDDTPQLLLAPPEPPPTDPVLPSQSLSSRGPTPPAPCSTQIPHRIQWPDPSNVSPDKHQHFSTIAAWDNTVASYLSTVHVMPMGDPNTYEYAIRTPKADSWKLVMEEMKCLTDNGTWELTDLQED